MAFILYCRNGHNLSKRDDVRMGRPTPGRIRAMMERAQWEVHEQRPPFCSECGTETIGSCEGCKTPIPNGRRPSYCGQCGRPFPWTERHLAAAADLVAEDELLSEEDKDLLTATFADMTSENPGTTLAVTRFKRLATKAGRGLGEALQKTLVDVVSETAKKLML